MKSTALLRALTLASVVVLAACNSGGDAPAPASSNGAGVTDGASDTASATGAASEAASQAPSEAASDEPVDPQAAELAEAAVLTLKGLGRAYQQTNEATGLTPYTKEDCDPDILSTVEAQYGGAMVKHKKEDAWIYSSSYVFPSTAEADAYVEARDGRKWLRCRAAQLDAYQKENSGKRYSVKIGAHGKGKGTLEDAYAVFWILFKGDPTGSQIARYVFTQGRVVINVGAEQRDNGANNDLTDIILRDMARAVVEAQKRVEKLD